MAADNTGTMIKLALLGAGGYFLYDWYSNRKPAVAVTPKTDATDKPGTVAFNSLDAIYQRLSTAVNTVSGPRPDGYTADAFNYMLQQQLPAGKTAPDPALFLPAGADRNATMTLPQYWGAVSPLLKSSLGLAGLGLYGTIGQAMARKGWA